MSDYNGNGHIAPKDRLRAAVVVCATWTARPRRSASNASAAPESCGDYGAGSWWSGFYGWLDRTSGYCGGFGPWGWRRSARPTTAVSAATSRCSRRRSISRPPHARAHSCAAPTTTQWASSVPRRHVIGERYTYHVVPKDKGGTRILPCASGRSGRLPGAQPLRRRPGGPLQSELFWRWCEDGKFSSTTSSMTRRTQCPHGRARTGDDERLAMAPGRRAASAS